MFFHFACFAANAAGRTRVVAEIGDILRLLRADELICAQQEHDGGSQH
jgi:hypothetical protein